MRQPLDGSATVRARDGLSGYRNCMTQVHVTTINDEIKHFTSSLLLMQGESAPCLINYRPSCSHRTTEDRKAAFARALSGPFAGCGPIQAQQDVRRHSKISLEDSHRLLLLSRQAALRAIPHVSGGEGHPGPQWLSARNTSGALHEGYQNTGSQDWSIPI